MSDFQELAILDLRKIWYSSGYVRYVRAGTGSWNRMQIWIGDTMTAFGSDLLPAVSRQHSACRG